MHHVEREEIIRAQGETSQGLPSRKLRHARKRTRVSAVLVPGLLVFGAVFFSLIALELYRAHTASPAGTHRTSTSAVNMNVKSAVSATPARQQQITAVAPASTAHSVQDPSQPAVAVPANKTEAQTEANPAPKSTLRTSTTAVASKPSSSSTATRPKVIRHLVKKGDTLYKLSRYYFGNHSGVKRIAAYNGLRPDQELIAGTDILIPLRP